MLSACRFLFLTFLIGFIFSPKLGAQPINNNINGTVIPAPNAAALGKYGDYRVGIFTGVPNISIPIHTVTESFLSLPITLDYHASGYKASELASWVGMGWSLNAGGIITRTIQGMADEINGYYTTGSTIPQMPQPLNAQYLQNVLVPGASGNLDLEPDLFTFNVSGYSGKFYIDHNGATALGKPAYTFIPKQDIKLEFEPTNFNWFTLITPDGVRYTFGQALVNGITQNARETSTPIGGISYTSSWYLLLVESPDKKFSIKLEYTNESYSYSSPTPCHQVVETTSCGSNGGLDPISCSGNGIDPYHYVKQVDMAGMRLTKITSSNESVDFNATVNRTDIGVGSTAKRLESIQIASGSSQIICRKYNFTYDYFQDPANMSAPIYKHLKLAQVQETSCDNILSSNPYIFTYEGTFLPYRYTKATDHWGFYNGATANESLYLSIPSTTMSITGGTYTYGSANKESNGIEMKKGMLTDITYPTGGKTSFIFEPNVAEVLSPVTAQKLYLQSCIATPEFCCGVQSRTSIQNPIQFTSTELLGSNTKFKLQLWPIPNNVTPIPSCANAQTLIGNVQAFRSSDNAAVGNPYSFNCTSAGGFAEQPLSFLQGNFNFIANTNYYFKIQTTDAYGTLTINSTTNTLQNKTVGGLRIKEIRNSPSGSVSSLDIVKSYTYYQNGSTTQSSGVLLAQPFYGFYATGYAKDQTGGCNTVYCGFSMAYLSENSETPLFSIFGNHIGYLTVTETSGNNGKTIFEHSFVGYPSPSNNYPYPPVMASAIVGEIKNEKKLNSTGQLISEVATNGAAVGQSNNAALIVKVASLPFAAIMSGCGNYPLSTALHNFIGLPTSSYYLTSDAYLITYKTETVDGIIKTTSYTYDNLNRFKAPISEQSTNSDGKVTLVEHKYPHNLPAGPLRDQLLARNIIGEPYETTEKVAGVQVKGTRKDFASFYSSGAVESFSTVGAGSNVRPYKFYNYEMTWISGTPTTGAWVPKGLLNSYTSFGLPERYYFANWTDPEIYAWNTNGTFASKTYKSFTTSYDYYPGTSLLRSIIPVDGIRTCFAYDKLGRLIKSTKYNATVNGSGAVVDGNAKTEFFYHYQNNPPSPLDPYNWIKTTSTFTPVTGSNLTSTSNIEYFDGLGRSRQTIKIGWSPNQKDVVSAVEYDDQGRVTKQYTPFETTTNTGAFNTSVSTGQTFSLNQYESSPLNRLVGVTPPSWFLNTTAYGTNALNEVGYYDGQTATSYYPVGTLFKQTSITPQSSTKNTERITYSDKKGRLILSRVREAGTTISADTYSFYDDKNRTVRVLPPGAAIVDANLRFDYTFDGADHMTSSKVPDKGILNIKYNLRDQAVLTQDANLLIGNKWLLSKFDDYGRVIQTGIHVSASPDPNAVLAFTDLHTTTTYGTTTLELDKIKTIQIFVPETPGVSTSITRTYGYDGITGRKLTDNGNNHLTAYTGSDNYTYSYDYAGNPLSEARVHKTSTSATPLTLTTRSYYDFSGRKTSTTHQINTNTAITLAQFAYDYRDRLIDKSLGGVTSGTTNSFLQSIDYAYNDQNWMTSINGASSFSALSASAIGLCSTNPVMPDPAEAAFAANPDGNDLFKMDLSYETAPFSFGSPIPQRNGNISQIVWQTRGRERQGYSYQYDYLDRLTAANYADINNSGVTSTDNKFQETLTYADARGNISSIYRKGLFKDPISATCYSNSGIDNLQFSYNTGFNRVSKILEITGGAVAKTQGFNPGSAANTATYGYDDNGNLKSDPYKAISSISYNHLDLPTTFAFTGQGSIGILYDYVGKKLRKTVTPTTGAVTKQDYVDGIEYKTTGTGALTLDAIYHSEGRITPIGTNWQYEYSIKDYLGNTRITFADLNNNKIVDVPGDFLQENHYYPFGMNMNYAWLNNMAQTDSKYQYNGKELNEDFGLNLYAYGYRYYDASVARFISVDPLAQKFPYLTTYQYASGNPVKNVDLDGLEGVSFTTLAGIVAGSATAMIEDVVGFGLDIPAPDNTTEYGKAFENAEQVGHAMDMVGGDAAAAIMADGAGTSAAVASATEGASLIPAAVLAVGAALAANTASNASMNMSKDKSYQTYQKESKTGGEPYSGRTSGDKTPRENVENRDKNHHKNGEYGPAKLDKSSNNPDAIRGREQELIDKNGGAKSSGGTSGNKIPGISDKNPKKEQYQEAAKKEFKN